jgi:hypothetical protein
MGEIDEMNFILSQDTTLGTIKDAMKTNSLMITVGSGPSVSEGTKKNDAAAEWQQNLNTALAQQAPCTVQIREECATPTYSYEQGPWTRA